MERDMVAGTLRLDFGWGKVKPDPSKPYERFVMAIVVGSTDGWSIEELLEKGDSALWISDNKRDVAQLVKHDSHFPGFLKFESPN
jgi:hypothetical protein